MAYSPDPKYPKSYPLFIPMIYKELFQTLNLSLVWLELPSIRPILYLVAGVNKSLNVPDVISLAECV